MFASQLDEVSSVAWLTTMGFITLTARVVPVPHPHCIIRLFNTSALFGSDSDLFLQGELDNLMKKRDLPVSLRDHAGEFIVT